jgi:predicted RNA-binding Zn ribbon-like protein
MDFTTYDDRRTPDQRSNVNIAYYPAVRPFRESGLLALDLANTWDPYQADPERLADTRELSRFLHEHGFDGQASHATLEHCRALRARLLAILTAPDSRELIARLNVFLSEVSEGAMVAKRLGGGWSVSLKPRSRARLVDRLAGKAAGEIVELVTTHGPERIRSCQASPCIEVFVDTSRNGRRRYCSHRCANRVNAARHRRRQRTGSA